MIFRKIRENDTAAFFQMLCRLDEETEYMMYEPGEREIRTPDTQRLRSNIKAADELGDLLLGAVNEQGEIVGFIWAERGKLNRILHTAYIVTGIRREYRRQGIGNEFFDRLEDWAEENGVIRLELTVECENTNAVKLYEKHGFLIEGTRAGSMKVNGRLVDEYYMGKLIK